MWPRAADLYLYQPGTSIFFYETDLFVGYSSLHPFFARKFPTLFRCSARTIPASMPSRVYFLTIDIFVDVFRSVRPTESFTFQGFWESSHFAIKFRSTIIGNFSFNPPFESYDIRSVEFERTIYATNWHRKPRRLNVAIFSLATSLSSRYQAIDRLWGKNIAIHGGEYPSRESAMCSHKYLLPLPLFLPLSFFMFYIFPLIYSYLHR